MSVFPNEKEKEVRNQEREGAGTDLWDQLGAKYILLWYPEWTFWCNATCRKHRVYTEG